MQNHDIAARMKELQQKSWNIHGKIITFYIPGMFRIDNQRGTYPGLSITGKTCELLCSHCKGRLLQNMKDCSNPDTLLKTCLSLDEQGYPGCLITGGRPTG